MMQEDLAISPCGLYESYFLFKILVAPTIGLFPLDICLQHFRIVLDALNHLSNLHLCKSSPIGEYDFFKVFLEKQDIFKEKVDRQVTRS